MWITPPMSKEQVFLAVCIKDHQEVLCFYVSDLGKDKIILGHNWLKRHNPNINWRDATINLSCCNFTCNSPWMTSGDSFPLVLSLSKQDNIPIPRKFTST